MNDRTIVLDLGDLRHQATIRLDFPDLEAVGQKGDRLWVKEPYRVRGGDYSEHDGSSGGEIEWYRCFGTTDYSEVWDPQRVPDDYFPEEYEEITDPNDIEEGVIGYITPMLPAETMPTWAIRTILDVGEITAKPEGGFEVEFHVTRRFWEEFPEAEDVAPGKGI